MTGLGGQHHRNIQQVASGAIGFHKFPYLLHADYLAILLGNNAQAGGTPVFRVGLFVKGEIAFQNYFFNY